MACEYMCIGWVVVWSLGLVNTFDSVSLRTHAHNRLSLSIAMATVTAPLSSLSVLSAPQVVYLKVGLGSSPSPSPKLEHHHHHQHQQQHQHPMPWQFIRATNVSIIHWCDKEGWSSVLSDPRATAGLAAATPLRTLALDPFTPASAQWSAAASPDLQGLQAVTETAAASGWTAMDALLLEYVNEEVVGHVAGLRVCQLAVKVLEARRVADAVWYPTLTTAGYSLAYEVDAGAAPAGSVALFVNAAHCNPGWLYTATHVPQRPAGAYHTRAVITVPRLVPTHSVEQLVDQCVHHMRQPLQVVVVVRAHAAALGAPHAALLNLARVYPGIVVVRSVPEVEGEDWEAAAWNEGIRCDDAAGGGGVVGTHPDLQGGPDVLLLLQAGAVVGHDIVHLTDAASRDVAGTGPFFPTTNAPRRGGPASPQFLLPSTFEATEGAAGEAGVISLPATLAVAGGLGGRAWAMHKTTLRLSRAAHAPDPPAQAAAPAGSAPSESDSCAATGCPVAADFDTTDAPFTSDLGWLEAWVRGDGEGRALHVVPSTFVAMQFLVDVEAAVATGHAFPLFSDGLVLV